MHHDLTTPRTPNFNPPEGTISVRRSGGTFETRCLSKYMCATCWTSCEIWGYAPIHYCSEKLILLWSHFKASANHRVARFTRCVILLYTIIWELATIYYLGPFHVGFSLRNATPSFPTLSHKSQASTQMYGCLNILLFHSKRRFTWKGASAWCNVITQIMYCIYASL